MLPIELINKILIMRPTHPCAVLIKDSRFGGNEYNFLRLRKCFDNADVVDIKVRVDYWNIRRSLMLEHPLTKLQLKLGLVKCLSNNYVFPEERERPQEIDDEDLYCFHSYEYYYD